MRRVVAILLLWALLPQVVTPAVAARQVSLKWIADWLAERATSDADLDRAIANVSQAHQEHDARYLATILSALVGGVDDVGDAARLVRDLGSQIVRLGGTPVAPPDLLAPSSASGNKWLPQRGVSVLSKATAIPVRASRMSVAPFAAADSFRASYLTSERWARGP